MPRDNAINSRNTVHFPDSRVRLAGLKREICTQMRDIVGEAVQAAREHGVEGEQALAHAGRALEMAPGRVRHFLRGEIERVWADELALAKAWRADNDRRVAAKLEHEAAFRRARAGYHDDGLV